MEIENQDENDKILFQLNQQLSKKFIHFFY
jgi:hypothetical protein